MGICSLAVGSNMRKRDSAGPVPSIRRPNQLIHRQNSLETIEAYGTKCQHGQEAWGTFVSHPGLGHSPYGRRTEVLCTLRPQLSKSGLRVHGLANQKLPGNA